MIDSSHRKWWTILPAYLVAGLCLGLADVHPPAGSWELMTLVASVQPVLVIACVGYAVLGTMTVLVSRSLSGRYARNISP